MLGYKTECKNVAREKGISVRESGNYIEVTYKQNWIKKFKVFNTWEEAYNFITTL